MPDRHIYLNDAEFEAVKSAIDIAYADGDAPIFDGPEGYVVVRAIERKFDIAGKFAPNPSTNRNVER